MFLEPAASWRLPDLADSFLPAVKGAAALVAQFCGTALGGGPEEAA